MQQISMLDPNENDILKDIPTYPEGSNIPYIIYFDYKDKMY